LDFKAFLIPLLLVAINSVPFVTLPSQVEKFPSFEERQKMKKMEILKRMEMRFSKIFFDVLLPI